MTTDIDAIGPLLHGVARAWRLKLDERLKPMGLSQAKWRTLLRLSMSPGPLTQAEIASHLGIEEPSLVTLLHRLEGDRWVARKNAAHDRRCKTVHLTRRAERVMVELAARPGEPVGAAGIQYMNRLSDFLFVASRAANHNGAGDVLWVPGQNR